VNPQKLSLLSDEELVLLAERIGIFIPEGLARSFLVEEILEAFEEDSNEKVFSHDGTGHVEEKKLSGSSLASFQVGRVEIPERYNETMIRALARDPAWIYAYWDISESKRANLVHDESGPNLFLRVSELPSSAETKSDFFDISIGTSDWKWYINVPLAGGSYRVDLCARASSRIKILARSNDVSMPVQFMKTQEDILQATKSLLILSGCESLHLTDRNDANPSRILTTDGE
jgi:hypothetical protein